MTGNLSRTLIRIAIDLMGGDQSPDVVVEAILVSLPHHPEVQFIAIGDQSYLAKLPDGVEKLASEEYITMEDSPLYAVRKKKGSSMAIGVQLLKEKRADVLLSLGNTGALVATATLNLPLLPTIERPSLIAMLPTAQGKVAVVDVGASIQASAKQLISSADLGVAFRRAYDQIKRPRLALLNIGREEKKGTQEVKEAYQSFSDHFKNKEVEFLGNMEGREVFQGEADVLVTDGFTGNVFLKTCEGASAFLLNYIKKEAGKTPLLTTLHEKFNYTEHPGALLAGLEGLIIKCHGNSNTHAILTSINGAIKLVQKDLLAKLISQFRE